MKWLSGYRCCHASLLTKVHPWISHKSGRRPLTLPSYPLTYIHAPCQSHSRHMRMGTHTHTHLLFWTLGSEDSGRYKKKKEEKERETGGGKTRQGVWLLIPDHVLKPYTMVWMFSWACLPTFYSPSLERVVESLCICTHVHLSTIKAGKKE